MPSPDLMTWNRDQRRWLKWYKGKMYAVSARQLGLEATKDASREAANNWWIKKQEEIDRALGAGKIHPTEVVKAYQEAIENHRLQAKWLRRHGTEDDARQRAVESERMVEWLTEALQSDDPPFPLTAAQRDPVSLILNPFNFLKWKERRNQVKREELAETAPPKENTIRAHVDDYLTVRKSQVGTGRITLGTYDTYQGRLQVFRNWVDPLAPITNVNEALWEKFFVHLSQQVVAGELKQSTMVGILTATREFVRSRWERRFIELPRNLNSKALSVSAPLQVVQTFTPEEITALLAKASERERLYLLLMLNCGFYPVDIAMLRQDEVDWDIGRISRKRSKTRNRSENVPTVDYPLWGQTFALLKQFRSTDLQTVLLNENGRPLWCETVKADGKFHRNSNVRCNYFRLQRKTGIKKPLKLLRKTSASMLENHAEYGRYAEHFLGEAPSSVASRHYVVPSKTQFNAAVKWLGQQFGIEPVPEPVVPAPAAAQSAGAQSAGAQSADKPA